MAPEVAPSMMYAMVFNLLKYAAGVVPVTLTRKDEWVYGDDGHNDVFTAATKKVLEGSEGLPVGVQVATLPFQDELCLRVMRELEGLLQFRKHFRPPVAAQPADTRKGQ